MYQKLVTLLEVRSGVMSALEEARKRKIINSPLQASVLISSEHHTLEILLTHADELASLFVVSEVKLQRPNVAEQNIVENTDIFKAGSDFFTVNVTPAKGRKCGRCWQYNLREDDTDICSRCRSVIEA